MKNLKIQIKIHVKRYSNNLKIVQPNIIKLLILIIFPFSGYSIFAQNSENKNYTTKKIDKLNITVDGIFNETEWQTANWEDNFIQYQPEEGKPPYQQTEFAILYDENNIYVAIKAIDTSPDSVSLRVSRHDETDGDLVAVIFDTYYDKRTAFEFTVSAAGVKSDMIYSNDGGNIDKSWDPIWWVKTVENETGWNAEMRIPLSQLRFDGSGEHLWGLQVMRFIFRKEEFSVWKPMHREKSGFVSQFGTISVNGMNNIQPKNTLHIMPYVVTLSEHFEKVQRNPFRNSGKKNSLDAGLDAKIGLTNNLTLDLTVNPDFGQVEADPSEVNLTTHETFFAEKRPFFIEGKNILTYNLMFGDGDGLFYSRRIGRKPGSYPILNLGEYADLPKATSILGASKITGKTKSGWSVGILESVTAKETAEIKGIGEDRIQTVEPFTNYFVGRLQKDYNKGNTYIGGMFTAVNRSINDSNLEFLHKSAYSGGMDFVHKWNDKKWEFNASAYFSHVTGTPEAITRTQKSFIRTFQRPDANYLTLDTTRTSLSGQGGKLFIGENGGNQKFMLALIWKSPGLELNDIGYVQSTDDIFQVFWTGYRFYKPFLIFREANLNLNQYVDWDFGGNVKLMEGNINGSAKLKNYWTLFGNFTLSGNRLANAELRGGPALKVPGRTSISMGFSSNQQKKITTRFSTSIVKSIEKDFTENKNINFGVGYRPVKMLNFNLSPGLSTSSNQLQYVTQRNYQGIKRYIFSTINRSTFFMSFRINYSITPDLSIQYWGQPFIATGSYSDFKHITNSKANKLTDRYQTYQNNQINYETNAAAYFIDDNADGQVDYNFGKPDFNVKEFLSNLVIRWEYKPGSTLFLVWSQTRSGFENDGSFEFTRDFEGLFNQNPHNIFLLKFSYRIGR